MSHTFTTLLTSAFLSLKLPFSGNKRLHLKHAEVILLVVFVLIYSPNIFMGKLILEFLTEIRKFTVPEMIRNYRKPENN